MTSAPSAPLTSSKIATATEIAARIRFMTFAPFVQYPEDEAGTAPGRIRIEGGVPWQRPCQWLADTSPSLERPGGAGVPGGTTGEHRAGAERRLPPGWQNAKTRKGTDDSRGDKRSGGSS